jgi:hypothetical protein
MMRTILASLFSLHSLLPQTTDLLRREPLPVLEVDKSVFVRSEEVRVWVGVNASDRVSPEKRKPGLLHIMRPDGVHESESISWPIDGCAGCGWKGGAGIEKTSAMPGVYRLWFEWDQKRSPDVIFAIRDWELQDRIVARWVVSGTEFRKAVAILEVENRTDQVLRVVRPGIAGSYVCVSSVQEGPHPSREDRFYPTRELLLDNPEHSSANADEAHWENLDRLPVVTIEPYSQFSQVLPLSKIEWQFPVVNSKLKVGTVLTIFVGDVGDKLSGLYPIRLQVSAERQF